MNPTVLRAHMHAADAAIAAIEQLTPDHESFEAGRAAAVDAIEVLKDAAVAALSPGMEPVGADLIADYEWYVAEAKRSSLMGDFAVLHEIALDSHPRLARLLRSSVIIERISGALE